MTRTGRRTATAIAVCALGAGLAVGLNPAAALASAPSGTHTTSVQTTAQGGDWGHGRNDRNDRGDGRYRRGGYWNGNWHYGQMERRHFRTIGRYRDWRECRDAGWRGQTRGSWSSFSYEQVGGAWVLYA